MIKKHLISILFIIIGLLYGIFVPIGLHFLFGEVPLQYFLPLMITQWSLWGVIFICFYKYIFKLPPWLGKLEFKTPLIAISFAIFNTALSIFIGGIMVALGVLNENNAQINDFKPLIDYFGYFYFFIFAAVVVPIAEEVFFRGFLFRYLLHVFKTPSIPLLISATIFAFVHGSLSAFPSIFAVAAIITFVYYKYESIILSILVHSGFNFISLLLLYLIDSGVIAI
jgi:membrane protease YdiL (CAAX protease family)